MGQAQQAHRGDETARPCHLYQVSHTYIDGSGSTGSSITEPWPLGAGFLSVARADFSDFDFFSP